MNRNSDPANLEFERDEMLAMGESTLRRVVDHIAALAQQPSCGEVGADTIELCRSLRAPAPEEGASLDALLDPLFSEWIPRSFGTPGPGYLAFIPGGGLFPALLADLVSNGTNRFTGIFPAAPALVQLEANALDWLRDWMDLPESARGLFTTGGSAANFNAIVAARERGLGTRLRDGVLYCSDQAHHSIGKSARLAGILPDRVRSIETDGLFRMRIDRLEAAIRADRAAGLLPFLVVSNAGTTNTGAVDPLGQIADLAAREGLWHHVDGAYGGFFHAVPELRPLLAGLPRADSVTIDPHKGLFLPYGTGCLLVRSGEDLAAVNASSAGYLPDAAPPEFYDPGRYGPDLSRGFPGLRVWMAFGLYGARKLRAAIAEKRTLALDAARRIERIPGLVVDAPPELSLFPFHISWPGAPVDEENRATKALVERTTARGRVMITGCTTKGRYYGRVCVLSFRTRQERIDALVEDLAAEAAAILAERRG